ncbi:beta-ketoacyl synthase [Bacteroidia bacterium]|nr:beta-ketoacyl synthase [Bacteroidia bacterium]
MIVRIGDNIISALGFTTDENYSAVKSGRSGLRLYDSCMDAPEPFIASLIDKERLNDEFSRTDFPSFQNLESLNLESLTVLEKASILSVLSANKEAQIDLANPRVLFIFSSTKGNVEQLTMNNEQLTMREDKNCSLSIVNYSLYLWQSAQLIVNYFKNPNTPILVSNACISGACAQIAAMRELESGAYDYAVVIGADMLSKFIISGFQSFKALSPEPCRPFNANRTGLNLGEAAATIIYANGASYGGGLRVGARNAMTLVGGAIRNDANHISGPSRTGEGSYRALRSILQDVTPDEIAFINAHGTATPYNDNMEAIAIARAGMDAVPVNSLKGCFGHTLGAAGVLESIVSMHALLDDTILPTRGFENKADDCSLTIVNQMMPTKKSYFIKMLSGFGGCNAALLFNKTE